MIDFSNIPSNMEEVNKAVEWIKADPIRMERFVRWIRGYHGPQDKSCPISIAPTSIEWGWRLEEGEAFCENVCWPIWGDWCPCKGQYRDTVKPIAEYIYISLGV